MTPFFLSEGTTLAVVWDRYCFDRRLRVLFLDAIERVEVAVRTQLTYHFAHAHGAFGHCDERNFPNLKIADYIDWRESLLTETNRSKEAFKKHFFKKIWRDTPKPARLDGFGVDEHGEPTHITQRCGGRHRL